MRKLVSTMVLAVVLVGSVKAANMDWAFKASTTTFKNDAIYVILSANWPTTITSATDFNTAGSTGGLSGYSGTLAASAGKSSAAGTLTGFSDTVTSQSFYFVIVDSTTGSYWKSALITSTYVYTDTQSSPGKATTATSPVALGTAGDSASGWTSFSAVPEPASVGLLMLGLCALGLKRKVA